MGFFEQLVQEIDEVKGRPHKVVRKIGNLFSRVHHTVLTVFENVEYFNDTEQNVQVCCQHIKQLTYAHLESRLECIVLEQLEKTPIDRCIEDAFLRELHEEILSEFSSYYLEVEDQFFKDKQSLQAIYDKKRQQILEMLTFVHFKELMLKKTIVLIKKHIVDTKSLEKEMDLLELSCRVGENRIFLAILEHGLGRKISNERLAALREIAASCQHHQLVKIVKELEAQPFQTRSTEGMLSLMKAVASPPARIGFSGLSPGFRQFLPSPIDHRLRTVDRINGLIAETPLGKTRVHAAWTIRVNQGELIKVFLDPQKADPLLEQRIDKPKPLREDFPENTKVDSTIVAKVDAKTLQVWQQKTLNNHRYRSQVQSMNDYRANDVASLAGFSTQGAWHWCHILAYTLGGPDGVKPYFEDQLDYMGPQREGNLVLGTLEANAQMLIIENLIKKLIYENKLPNVYIIAKPTFVKGLEAYHVAETIEYTIQDKAENPDRQISVTFDMLTRRKITLEEVSTIGAVFQKIFMKKSNDTSEVYIETPKHPRQRPSTEEVGSPFASPPPTKTIRRDIRPTQLDLSSAIDDDNDDDPMPQYCREEFRRKKRKTTNTVKP